MSMHMFSDLHGSKGGKSCSWSLAMIVGPVVFVALLFSILGGSIPPQVSRVGVVMGAGIGILAVLAIGGYALVALFGSFRYRWVVTGLVGMAALAGGFWMYAQQLATCRPPYCTSTGNTLNFLVMGLLLLGIVLTVVSWAQCGNFRDLLAFYGVVVMLPGYVLIFGGPHSVLDWFVAVTPIIAGLSLVAIGLRPRFK